MLDDLNSFLVLALAKSENLEELFALYQALPKDFPASIIVFGVAASAKELFLTTAIIRKELPVEVAVPGMRLMPNTMYLCENACFLEENSEHVVFQIAAESFDERPSRDALVASAAEIYEDRLLIVPLSGNTELSLENQAILEQAKNLGALILSEAAAGNLPLLEQLALLVRPGSLADRLTQIIHSSNLSSAKEKNAFDALLYQIHETTGINFSEYKISTILRRLSRLMIAEECSNIYDYKERIDNTVDGYKKIASSFLINVTHFFRDKDIFDKISEAVLPQLITHARAGGTELRIWSSGTSSGEEAYSLAMLCAEAFDQDRGHPVTVKIFATDLDARAIEKARRGIYDAQSLTNVSQDRIDRFFMQTEHGYQVTKRIRSMVIFGEHDLAQRAPFPQIDLCLCRNVMIYFTKPLQKRCLQAFAFALRDEGFLVVGKSETTNALGEFFRQVYPQQKIFQRQGGRFMFPLARLKTPVIGVKSNFEYQRPTQRTGPAVNEQITGKDAKDDLYDTLVENGNVGLVVIHKRYKVARINTAAREMLDIRGIGVGDDIIHLVRNIDSEQLRDIIDAAFRNELSPAREVRIEELAGSGDRWLDLSCAIPALTRGEAITAIALICVDVTDGVIERNKLNRALEAETRKQNELTSNVNELSKRQKILFRANTELVNENNGLHQMNEQLLIALEESASAHEEVETLNEEMQSTNEELETLNEELQATIEELNTTNDELESRRQELESKAKLRHEELHASYDELKAFKQALDQFDESVILMRHNGEIVHASPAWEGYIQDQLAGLWWQEPRVKRNGRVYELRPISLDNTELLGFVLAPIQT